MKSYKFLLTIALGASIAFSACDREDSDYLSKVVDVSYPSIKLKGDSILFLDAGTPFTDPGATLTDDLTKLQSDITALDPTSVDINTPSLYLLEYRAANTNGFEIASYRTVIVRPNYTGTVDLAGRYLRSPNGAEVNITSQGMGLYIIDNVGGVIAPSPAILPVYMFQTNDTLFDIPLQQVPNDYGTLEATNEEITNPTTLKWKVVNPGFGTSVRTFNKQ